MTSLNPVPPARAFVRWSLGHALPRTAIQRSAKQGDLHGRMFLATRSGDQAALDPVLDELRAHAPFYRGTFASVTADHAAVRALLSSPDAAAGLVPADADGRLARPRAWPCRMRHAAPSPRHRCW